MAQLWGSLMSTKSELRIQAKEIRKKLDMKTISHKLALKLKNTKEYKNAKNIMIFYPKNDEVDLIELLDDKSKNFFLPKISGEELLCCPYKKNEELCESCFKTKEPLTESVDETIIDLVIAPALAVDKNNYRLGYGGGFYDRLFARIHCIKIVCIPKELVVNSVYPEKHDIIMTKIILS